jgi:transposase InsO family protein
VLRRRVESAQYTSAELDAFTARNRIRRSRGRTGVCWDNAAPPNHFFATLKNEMYYRHTFATRARARFAIAEYIEVFCNRGSRTLFGGGYARRRRRWHAGTFRRTEPHSHRPRGSVLECPTAATRYIRTRFNEVVGF